MDPSNGVYSYITFQEDFKAVSKAYYIYSGLTEIAPNSAMYLKICILVGYTG